MKKSLRNLGEEMKLSARLFAAAVHPFYAISGWTWREDAIPPTASRLQDHMVDDIDRWINEGCRVPYHRSSGGLHIDIEKEGDGQVVGSYSFIFSSEFYEAKEA